MAKLISYEEFEREFKDSEPKLNKVEQARRDRITNVLNQRVNEVCDYGETFVKKELALIDLRMEEILIIEKLSQSNLIEGKPTNVAYESYKKECLNGGIEPMNQIGFSKFVVKYFDYEIHDKKIKGKKYRIFINLGRTVKNEKRKKLIEEWWK